ncbi:hypothetical protein CIT292_10674 [Citrobacter youngae ATCC 29220]|uniref:Uncharacterized protein n=1 Tax=Citrobacter youngae ATCC 29220 TaxID=500640 RepID=D4BK58_9ENTR|nr:hypothetical protein CIT292_10674 [Citrobacter youngae ATCC 29220]
MNRRGFNCLILEHFHHHDQCVIGGENLVLHKIIISIIICMTKIEYKIVMNAP